MGRGIISIRVHPRSSVSSVVQCPFRSWTLRSGSTVIRLDGGRVHESIPAGEGGMNFFGQKFRWGCGVGTLLLALLATSCRTIPPLPAVNLSEPGWTLHQGQVLWRSQKDAPEIAGEILFATHGPGRTMLQMTKTPLPFVTVQTRGEEWEIEFVPQRRSFSGRGTPTPRLLWIHLARALNGTKPPEPLRFEQTEPHGFTLENPKTGESISGFLNE